MSFKTWSNFKPEKEKNNFYKLIIKIQPKTLVGTYEE